ncbi:hypothetical protein FNV43_RR21398 [Rhamnella rubrinervis]|uniref:Uncharacterized protein n=1 Tax=Rhamnella rubrinervis TaxID=2594499 RepID=A0A8K0DWK2_9ROSA|nr:hypothetical protein FNV43_RR21398 [Rhamnella rubrinervis]
MGGHRKWWSGCAVGRGVEEVALRPWWKMLRSESGLVAPRKWASGRGRTPKSRCRAVRGKWLRSGSGLRAKRSCPGQRKSAEAIAYGRGRGRGWWSRKLAAALEVVRGRRKSRRSKKCTWRSRKLAEGQRKLWKDSMELLEVRGNCLRSEGAEWVRGSGLEGQRKWARSEKLPARGSWRGQRKLSELP